MGFYNDTRTSFTNHLLHPKCLLVLVWWCAHIPTMIYLPKSPAGVREPILLHPLLIVSIYHAARWEEYRPARLNEILVLISQPPGLVHIIRLGILSAAFFKVAFMINPEISLYPTSGSSCSYASRAGFAMGCVGCCNSYTNIEETTHWPNRTIWSLVLHSRSH